MSISKCPYFKMFRMSDPHMIWLYPLTYKEMIRNICRKYMYPNNRYGVTVTLN